MTPADELLAKAKRQGYLNQQEVEAVIATLDRQDALDFIRAVTEHHIELRTEAGVETGERSQAEQGSPESAARGPICGFGITLFLGGAVAEWKLKMQALSALSSNPTLGSDVMGLVGAIGMLLVLLSIRHWVPIVVIVFGYLLDMLLTLIFVLPLGVESTADMLSVWPFFLSSLSTLIAAFALGLLAPKASYFYGTAIVSLDMLIAWLARWAEPQPLTWTLIARITAAYGAGLAGAYLGKRIRHLRTADGEAVRGFLRETFVELVGGVLVAVVTYFLLS